MRALLVTSRITYVPRNYQRLFENVIEGARAHVAGLVLLDNLSWSLGRDIAGLALLGCRRVSGHLLKNLAELPLRRREKLFESQGIPVFHGRSMNDREMIDLVRLAHIDLIVNLRTRCIYKPPVLQAPRLGCINIHHGLLPEFRGTLCDLYALSEDRPAGFTIHQMNEKIDAGRILVRREVSRPGERDFTAYLERASEIEGQELARLLHMIDKTGELPRGELNACFRPTYSRNPNRRQIHQMRKRGIVL